MATLTTNGKSTVVNKGEGRALWMLGSLYEVKATAEQTGGMLSVIEMTIAPSLPMGAPPHTHDVAEAVYVLEGSLRFHVGGKTVEATAGSFLYFPKGTLEWFANPTNRPAKILTIYTPGGMDKFFQEVAEPAKARILPPPPSGPPDFAGLSATAKKYGLKIQEPHQR